jgi:uncharacterized Ntn-hydrolase superfamily protein
MLTFKYKLIPMKKLKAGMVSLMLFFGVSGFSQGDTFSIVGLDTITGEVGSAGASCVDLFQALITNIGFLGDLFPGKGAINTQASYLSSNQANARMRMLAGDTPPQIISWLTANDVQSDPTSRQYGIVAMVSGTPVSAGFTGTNCLNYKNHIAGRNYCIQGNILLGQQVLDSMESKFKRTPGTLACKLMAALQGAKMIGADTRCSTNNTSSLFAFLKVAQPGDPDGSPYISMGVRTHTNAAIEPIDSLQKIANNIGLCSIITSLKKNDIEVPSVFPNPAINYFSVLNAGQVEKMVIRNIIGETILEVSGSELKNPVDISTFKSGVYLVELGKPGDVRRQVVRLVKN